MGFLKEKYERLTDSLVLTGVVCGLILVVVFSLWIWFFTLGYGVWESALVGGVFGGITGLTIGVYVTTLNKHRRK